LKLSLARDIIAIKKLKFPLALTAAASPQRSEGIQRTAGITIADKVPNHYRSFKKPLPY